MAEIKRVNLALQGGGAHGAFTWGVLDRLIEDERIEVAAISGTSAGALNGAAFKAGWIAGGRAGAKAQLDRLWARMGAVEDLRMPGWMAGGLPAAGTISAALEMSPGFVLADATSRMVSPYATGPFYTNPLRPVVNAFEFDKVCAADGPALFVCATNVHDGKIRIFSGPEISTEAILASACLPTLFRAVEIDGAHYWDGGYTGNPALFPLFDGDLPDDVVIVNINPLERPDVPRSAQEIQNRINEISFNSSLLRELRAIRFAQRLLRSGALEKGAMKDVLAHMIADDELMRELSVATKLVPTAYTLKLLKDAGRTACDGFLAAHFDDIGNQSSIDIEAMFN